MRAHKRFAGVTVVAIIVTTTAILGFATRFWNPFASRTTVITIATMANAGDTLFFVAGEQGYFRRNGLDVTLTTYPNGLVATESMIAGNADLSYATEFVVVRKALEKEDIAIVTAYSKNETIRLVGRTDRGIKGVSDLRGKRIGLARGAITEFYLGRFLELNGMHMDDVALVHITNTAELGNVLNAGEVDAAVVASRHTHGILTDHEDERFVWPVQAGQAAYGTLVGRTDWIAQHPDLLERLLKSLAQAESYLVRHPDRAKALMQQRLDYDDAYTESVWSEYWIALSLDQALIIAMEDQARWMIANDLTHESQVPDFLSYIYTDGLEAIQPKAVNIIK
jgi:ABC-type nitrate/sulfonate/bicarbonate transport system substrate-binding protein